MSIATKRGVIALGSKLQCQVKEEHIVEEEFQTGCDIYPEFIEDDMEKLGTVLVETVCKKHEGETIVEEDRDQLPLQRS